MRIGYRLHTYNESGDIEEVGIFIYFGDITILKFKNVEELEDVITNLQKCTKEAEELKGQ